MQRTPTPIDPTRCPLCGGPNGCALAGVAADAGAPLACWCMSADFSAALLARVPQAARTKACVCAVCVAAAHNAAPERRQ